MNIVCVHTRVGWNFHFSHIEKITGDALIRYSLNELFLTSFKLWVVIAVRMKCVNTQLTTLKRNHVLIWALFCCAERIIVFMPLLFSFVNNPSGSVSYQIVFECSWGYNPSLLWSLCFHCDCCSHLSHWSQQKTSALNFSITLW